jgi:hypothetical protein
VEINGVGHFGTTPCETHVALLKSYCHWTFEIVVGGAVGVGVGATVGDGVGVGVAATTTFTPLFHTSFLPLLTQVYLIPLTVEVEPAFVQGDPALTEAEASGEIAVNVSETIINVTNRRLIYQKY